jgi:AcrR family transcriptional regulator
MIPRSTLGRESFQIPHFNHAMTSARRTDSATKRKSTSKSTPKPRGRPKAMVGRPRKDQARPDAADRILDAAEDLFSKRGFDGVTIREVTELAHVDSALVHYYFTSKQGLFDAVLGRRAELVFAERMLAFDELDRAGGKVTIEDAVRAFIQPLLARAQTGDAGWKNYFRLLSVVNNDPNHVAQSVMSYFDPVVHRLIDALSRALPKAKREELFWCFHFLTGSLTLALSRTGRLDRVSGGLCKSEDLGAIEPRMVEYCAAGIRHVCVPDSTAAPIKPRRVPTAG